MQRDKTVTLTRSQANLCRAGLSHQLGLVARQLARGQTPSGSPLDAGGRRNLTRHNMDLQMTLLALGMTSAQLEGIVKQFSQLDR